MRYSDLFGLTLIGALGIFGYQQRQQTLLANREIVELGRRLEEKHPPSEVWCSGLCPAFRRQVMSSIPGIVIGRFQVPDLHQGHRTLIETAMRLSNDRTLVLVGSAGASYTSRNPLPIELRVSMVRESYPAIKIDIIRDAHDDQVWSEQVDEVIRLHFGPVRCNLYHGRDSFAKHYLTKRHSLVEVPEVADMSGTAVRRAIQIEHSSAFRRGIIFATLNKEVL